MKTIIERGASWTLEETKMLLALWGQDLVQRQATNTKRTKEVYEKISEKFNQNGFERTAEQVRTRVFNMIAEYRRILKDPNPERMKKCIFFEALHKIYQARHMDDVKSALDDYEPEYPYSPTSNTISSERGDESVSDSEATDGNETTTINNSTTMSTAAASSTAPTQPTTASSTTSPTATSATTLNATSSNIQMSNNNTNNNENDNFIISHHFKATNNDNNIGDSNNINNAERDSPVNSHVQTGTASGGSKRIKLEKSPNQSQANSNPNSSSTPSDHANAKQNKSSSSTSSSSSNSSASVPIVANLGSGPSVAASSSSLAALAGATSSTPTSSSQRHQSLLLPHATTSSSSTTSTPISKLTTSGANSTPSYINVNSARLPIIRTNQLIGHSNGNDSINLNGATSRLPTTAAITSHQLYQAPVNTFDVTSSALLIDRMFAHLSRESENMREWIALEKERLALERTRRQQETEREVRRERVLIDTLMRFQEQWLAFVTRLDPRILENATESPPELKIPPRETPSAGATQNTQTSTNSTTSTNISTPETKP